jgi:hypothetical protein
LELCSAVCILGTGRIISTIQGNLGWRRLLAVNSPVICTFTPVLSCKAISLFLKEYPVNKVKSHLGDFVYAFGFSHHLFTIPKEPSHQSLSSGTLQLPSTQKHLEGT